MFNYDLKEGWTPTFTKKKKNKTKQNKLCKSSMLGPTLFFIESYIHCSDNSQGENIYKNVSILLGENFEFKMFMF